MKIEGYRPNSESSSLERADSNQDAACGVQQVEMDRRSGRIHVSRETSLVDEALQAADETPNIRREVVERARLKLASGDVGADADKLADTLIDQMLGR
ncbi:MAG: flagellar biosynthesis anti-sigma factor FlgM [Vicinamibacterales bacterium]